MALSSTSLSRVSRKSPRLAQGEKVIYMRASMKDDNNVFCQQRIYNECDCIIHSHKKLKATEKDNEKLEIGGLENKVALITGGANGLGKATAQEFIKQGAKVLIADIDTTQGPNVAKSLGSNAQFIQCDVSNESNVAQAIDTAIAQYGKLDIMYNNAGIVGQNHPPSIADLDLDQFDRMMRVNIRGAMAGIKHASRVMNPAGSGSILCTASICGLLGGLGPHGYSISKFGIHGIVKSLASELSKHGIRINCVSPGPVATQMAINGLGRLYEKGSPEQLKSIIHGLGELKGADCEEIDIAKAALYLASDEAKYVTGHNLVVDGGMTSFKTLHFPSPTQFM